MTRTRGVLSWRRQATRTLRTVPVDQTATIDRLVHDLARRTGVRPEVVRLQYGLPIPTEESR
jgi:hypothetical protein